MCIAAPGADRIHVAELARRVQQRRQLVRQLSQISEEPERAVREPLRVDDLPRDVRAAVAKDGLGALEEPDRRPPSADQVLGDPLHESDETQRLRIVDLVCERLGALDHSLRPLSLRTASHCGHADFHGHRAR